MLMALVRRVDLKPDRVEINIRAGRLIELLGGQCLVPITQQGKSDKEAENILTLSVRARLQRVGREMRLLVNNGNEQATPDPGLLRIIARAHDIQERLVQNTDLTVHSIAHQERVSANYVSTAFCASPAWRLISSPPLSTARTRRNSPPRN